MKCSTCGHHLHTCPTCGHTEAPPLTPAERREQQRAQVRGQATLAGAFILAVVFVWVLVTDTWGATAYAPLGVLGLWFGSGCPNPARAWWRSVQAKRENR